jgi:hypothetical protein
LPPRKTDRHIAETLNARWLHTGTGQFFTRQRVRRIREAYGIRSLAQHIRDGGWRTPAEIGAELHIHHSSVKRFALEGVLKARRINDKGDILIEPLNGPLPRPHRGKSRKVRFQTGPGVELGKLSSALHSPALQDARHSVDRFADPSLADPIDGVGKNKVALQHDNLLSAHAALKGIVC